MVDTQPMPRNFAFTVFAFLLLAIVPAQADDSGFSADLDIPYGELPWQNLDVYRPSYVDSNTPVLVFFFGGGWTSGDKGNLQLVGQSFASQGITFVAPNYRLGSAAIFPAFVEDTAKAIAYVLQHVAVQEGATRPTYVGGWSAGAYNAAMVSLNQEYLAGQGASSNLIRGFIGLAGPYGGGLCAGIRCSKVFPDSEKQFWAAAEYIDETDPAILLVYGGLDRFVDRYHHEDLAAAAREKGVEVEVLELPDKGHSSLLSYLKIEGSDVQQATMNFITQGRAFR